MELTIIPRHPISSEQDRTLQSTENRIIRSNSSAPRLIHINPLNLKKKCAILRAKKRSYKAVFGTVLFICAVMIIAILIICLTTPKTNYICQSNYQTIIDEDSYEQNSYPISIKAADINHDNFTDIIVTNSGTNNIGIFINYGNGTFSLQKTFSTENNSRPISLALADFNNDTHLDIVVANYDTHSIEIFIGNGNGNFSNETRFSTGIYRPVSIDVGDFNNDHWLDIVVANNGTNNIGIFFGCKNGSFENQIIYSTGYDSSPYYVVIDDFNNDNNLDIAVANYGTNNIGIFLGFGNGNFTNQITYSTGLRSCPYSIDVNDLNNDGQLDIAVVNSGTNNIGIFFGYGNGSFMSQKIVFISPQSSPHSIIIADFNNDNTLDIAISNHNTNNITILIGYGNGSFTSPTIHSTGIDSGSYGIIAADFDNDKHSDIALVNFDTNNIFVFIGYSMIQSQNPTVYSAGAGSVPSRIAVADFDNDTHLDLALVNYGAGNVGIFLGYGNGSFQDQMPYLIRNNSRPYALSIGDIDSDNQLDIVISDSSSDSFGILYGYGNGTFATIIMYTFMNTSSIRGIIVEDFNNDNHLDIAFTSFGTNTIGILLGYGNRSFANLISYSTGIGSRPISIAAGDLNNNGRLDLVVANSGTNNIAIFLGLDDDSFTLFTTYSTGDGSIAQMLTIADLNRDNYLDIIVNNFGISNVGIFYGFGNGSFNRLTTHSTGSNSAPTSVSVADFNNDHSLDIAVANSGIHSVGIFLGNSYGYFSNQTTYPTGPGSAPNSIAIGDFNKDNRLDIAVANYGANNVAILLGHPEVDSENQIIDTTNINSQSFSITVNNFNYENQSNSTNENWMFNDVPVLLGNYYADFRTQTIYSTGSAPRPYSIDISDLNNDTQMDIIVANSGNESIGILLGYDNGSFAPEIFYPIGVGSSPRYVIVEDLNNDNNLDIVVTNPINNSIILLIGNDNLTFSPQITYSTGLKSNPNSLTVSNFNNDKYLDLVVTNEGTDTIGIFFGSDYTVFARQKSYETGTASSPYSVTTGDFNNDGQLDIVSGLFNTNNIGIFLGYGNGTFTSVMNYAYVPLSRPRSIATGDFNNDNQLDITIANWGIDSISVVLGNGDGTFIDPILYSTGIATRPISIAVEDFNNDNYLDIITANDGGNSISVFFGYGNGTFRNVITLSTGKSSAPNAVYASDINNDGQLDIIVANRGTHNVGIFLGYGNGSFSEQVTFSSGDNSSPYSAITSDFNKDGKLDIAIANYGAHNIAILFGYGNGTFGHLQTYTTGIGSNPTNMYVADFNNNNNLDIIVADEVSNNANVFFGYGDGTFATVTTIPIRQGSILNSIVVADFNNDNRLDFTITDRGNNNIEVFLGNGSELFGGQTTFFVGESSHPTSLVVGHFNNDKQLDIAIANSGTNNIGILFGYGNRTFSNITTYSTGDDSQPISLAIGDLNNDSLTDIVVANSNTDDIGIFIGDDNGSFSNLMKYSMGARSIPMSIAVGDFNRDYQMDIAVANFGTNNVCILFGYGNGTFTNQTWYPLGYGANPNWIMFKDLNNDGWDDITVSSYDINSIKVLWNRC